MPAKRNTPTKQQVKRAFIEIVNEKGLERLSMSDIARRAGVNRGTLYLHYTDKYDLMRQLEDEALDRLAGILFAPLPAGGVSTPGDLVPDDAILEALRYVRDERDFFKVLVSPGGDTEFVERVKNMIGRSIFDEIRQSGLRQASDPRYARRVCARNRLGRRGGRHQTLARDGNARTRRVDRVPHRPHKRRGSREPAGVAGARATDLRGGWPSNIKEGSPAPRHREPSRTE